jgi:hypothetical protein
MNASDLDALIHACLDGQATDEEITRLEVSLASDPAARDRYLCLADLHACLAIDESLWQEPAGRGGDDLGPAAATHRIRPTSFRVPFAAAAVGLLVGLCGAGLAFGYVVPMLSRPLVIFADGFESGPGPECRGLAGRAGVWSGDESRVVSEDQGILPAKGQRMLRLLRADYPGKSGGDSYISDTFRVIDLRPYRDVVVTGGAIVTVTARYSAVSYPKDEIYQAGVCLYAIDSATFARISEIADEDLAQESLAMAQRRNFVFDHAPETWQLLDGELRLPAAADYVVIRMSVFHAQAAQRRATFGGHYLDDVIVSLQ